MTVRPETFRFYKSFAAAAKEARLAHGLSTKELSVISGMPLTEIGKYEGSNVRSVSLHIGLVAIQCLGLRQCPDTSWEVAPEMVKMARKKQLQDQAAALNKKKAEIDEELARL